MQITSPLKPRPKGARKLSLAQRLQTEDKPAITHGFFKSFDGTKIFYSIEGQGKPLVFCYGLVCSSLHWTYQIEHLRKNYRTIWFDYRGHHNSEVPVDLNSLTLENISKDLGLLLDELGIDKTVILGHSMGVNVVLDFCRQQPNRVAGMVLANGTAKRPLETMFNMNVFQAGFKILRKAYDFSPRLVELIWKTQNTNPISRLAIGMGGFNPHLTPKEDVQLYLDQIAEMDPRILIYLIENYDTYDATSWLHTIKTPTLIMAGDQDHIIPLEQQELMHQLIPGSQFEIIRHGSHCPQMDLPELFSQKIELFLKAMNY